MFLFTDKPASFFPGADRDVVRIETPYRRWPGPTLYRYHTILKTETLLKEYDYIYYIDIDMMIKEILGEEILGELVAVIHPGYWDSPRKKFTYETRIQSKAYIPPDKGTKYYAGGFEGGSAPRFINVMKTMREWIDIDLKNGIIPIWHDESIWNAYLYQNPPTVELSPSYCYPESWSLPFPKKIIALDKNHAKIRGWLNWWEVIINRLYHKRR